MGFAQKGILLHSLTSSSNNGTEALDAIRKTRYPTLCNLQCDALPLLIAVCDCSAQNEHDFIALIVNNDIHSSQWDYINEQQLKNVATTLRGGKHENKTGKLKGTVTGQLLVAVAVVDGETKAFNTRSKILSELSTREFSNLEFARIQNSTSHFTMEYRAERTFQVRRISPKFVVKRICKDIGEMGGSDIQ